MVFNASRHRLAILLSLSLCTAIFAANAYASTMAYSKGISEANDFARQRQWAPAIEAARRAYNAADNNYEQIESGYMIGRLQQQAGDISGVLDTFKLLLPQVRCADGARDASQLLALSAHFALLNDDPLQSYQLIAQSIQEVQKNIDPWGQIDPKDWVVQDDGHSVQYRLAALNLPTLTGKQILRILNVGDRNAPARLDYVDVSGQAPLKTLQITVHLRDDAAKEAALNDDLDALMSSALMGNLARQKTPDIPVVTQFAPAGSQYAASITGYSDIDQDQSRQGVWIARLAAWQVEVEATWKTADDNIAQKALAEFFAAIQWHADEALAPKDNARFATLQAQAVNEITARNWKQAHQLADTALPLAMFPDERARLYSVRGIAASELGDLDDAMSSLQNAISNWHYSVMARNDEDLFDQAMFHAADTAFRQGKPKLAIGWLNEVTKISIDGSWHLDMDTGVMQHRATSIRLPPRLGVFLRESYSDHTAYYVRTHPAQRIGVTILASDKVTDLDGTIAWLRHWMQKTMGLEVSDVEHTPFAPAARGTARGDFVLFHVTRPDPGRGTVDISPYAWPTGPRMMGFWISHVEGARILLRSEWAPGDVHARNALNEAAREFDWPASVEHMAKLSYKEYEYRLTCRQ